MSYRNFWKEQEENFLKEQEKNFLKEQGNSSGTSGKERQAADEENQP